MHKEPPQSKARSPLRMMSLNITLIVLSTYLAIRWFFKVTEPSTLTAAPVIQSTDPFGSKLLHLHNCIANCFIGIRAIIDAAQHIRTNSFFEWIRKALNVPGHTAELQALGTRIIITDNPENVQAILSSNVHIYVIFFSPPGPKLTFAVVFKFREGPDSAQSLAGFDAGFCLFQYDISNKQRLTSAQDKG
jgi:hypothetical protein